MEDTPNNTRNSRMARMPTLVANNLHLIVFVDQIWMEQLSKWGSFATTYGYPVPVSRGPRSRGYRYRPVQLGPEVTFGDRAP